MTTINDRLKDLRYQYGQGKKTQQDLQKAMGIPDSSISDYEKPGMYVPSNVIMAYCDYFKVSADYLLGRTEIRNQSNTELHELHLSEKAIKKLKEHKVNPEIVSDLIEHPEFEALILDMDIYSKGFIDEGIQYINQIMKVAREKLSDIPKESYDKDRDEKTINDLMVSQDHYFSYAISERINIILRDIRKKHSKDIDSSDITPDMIENQIKELTESISEVKNAPKGSVAKAIRNGLMLAFHFPHTPEYIAIMDEYVKNLKIDNASTRNLVKMSSVIESNQRSRRNAKAKLKKKK